MGVVLVRSSKTIMKTFVALSALVAATLAAPAADADAQLLGAGDAGLAGYTGLGGVGYSGLAGGYSGVAAAPYAAGVVAAPAATYAAAPAVSYAAAPAVAYAAAPVATVHHTVHQPIVPVHQVREHVITAPVVRQVGVNVHHQVKHIPQVHVDTKTSHAVTHHVINHAPQIGAFVAPAVAAAAIPVAAAASPIIAIQIRAQDRLHFGQETKKILRVCKPCWVSIALFICSLLKSTLFLPNSKIKLMKNLICQK